VVCFFIVGHKSFAAETGDRTVAAKTKGRKKNRTAKVTAVACVKLKLFEDMIKLESREGADIYQSSDRLQNLILRCEASGDSPEKVLKSWRAQKGLTRISANSFYFDSVDKNKDSKDSQKKKSQIRVYIHYSKIHRYFVTIALVVSDGDESRLSVWHSKVLNEIRRIQ
jgi:hypothetical protein